MWYMIYGMDHADSMQARTEARPAHLARLQSLRDAGRLLLAGPLPDPLETETPRMLGSLVLAEFSSLDEARAWAGDDPYVHAGVYREVLVTPWKGVFMPECN